MRRTLIIAIAVLVVAGGATAYQFTVKNRRPPSFSQGGTFVNGADLPRAGKEDRPFPYGDSSSTSVTSTTGAGPGKTVGTSAATTTTVKPAAVAVVAHSAAPVVPTAGAYNYAVDGSEGASGFGSRDFPDTMSLVVHTDPAHAEQRVLDLRFSQNHEEREILGFGANGVAFTYEAGSITFGPGTQTSEGSYAPPMVQIPWPLAVGAKASDTSPVTSSSGGRPRTEKWTTTITGRETLTVLGSPHETWVVEIQRNTTPGTAEQVDRYRKYWYDPALGIWVKWIERFNASRDSLVTFKYHADYTATLQSFTPA